MRERYYRIQGIILKRINCGESDKIITLFTREKGKMCCIAKGIRKICSKRAPCLELFNEIEAYCAKGKNLDVLTEVKTVRHFPKLQNELKLVTSAYYLVELVDRLTAENQEHTGIYELLGDALEAMHINCKFDASDIIEFQKRILQNLGFGLPYKLDSASLEFHIENITERRMNSAKFLTNLV